MLKEVLRLVMSGNEMFTEYGLVKLSERFVKKIDRNKFGACTYGEDPFWEEMIDEMRFSKLEAHAETALLSKSAELVKKYAAREMVIEGAMTHLLLDELSEERQIKGLYTPFEMPQFVKEDMPRYRDSLEFKYALSGASGIIARLEKTDRIMLRVLKDISVILAKDIVEGEIMERNGRIDPMLSFVTLGYCGRKVVSKLLERQAKEYIEERHNNN